MAAYVVISHARRHREQERRHFAFDSRWKWVPDDADDNQGDKGKAVKNAGTHPNNGHYVNEETGQRFGVHIDCETVLRQYKEALLWEGEKATGAIVLKDRYNMFCGPIERASPASSLADGLQSLQKEGKGGIHMKLQGIAYATFCGPT